jgi:hypothetical protein
MKILHTHAIYRMVEHGEEKFPLTADEAHRVTDNKAFPLVRELAHKYDLQVLGISGETIEGANIYLSRADGVALCRVYWMKDKEAYAIQNVMVTKDRGRDYTDKLTFFGKRVSFLMKVIEEKKLIPETTDDMFRQVFSSDIYNMLQMFSNTFGEVRKHNLLTGEEVHRLLMIVLNNQSADTLSKESMDKVKLTLDKYGVVDSMRAKRAEEIREVFTQPMRVIGNDALGSFIVGKIHLQPQWGYGDDMNDLVSYKMEITEPFKRVNDVVEVEDVITTMAMLKTHLQQLYPNMTFKGDSGFYPESFKGIIKELNVMAFNKRDSWGNTALLKPSFIFMPS